MHNYSGKDLARAFRTVRNNTLMIANEIPESKYDFQPAPDCRSVGKTLVHIALGPGFQHYMHSNKVTDLKTVNFGELVQKAGVEEAKPRTKAEIVQLLKAEGDKFASYLEGLSDGFLSEDVTMPPGADPATKTRFEMLLSPKEHEMHHRGQLMTMQRMMGLVPHLTREREARMAQQAQATR